MCKSPDIRGLHGLGLVLKNIYFVLLWWLVLTGYLLHYSCPLWPKLFIPAFLNYHAWLPVPAIGKLSVCRPWLWPSDKYTTAVRDHAIIQKVGQFPLCKNNSDLEMYLSTIKTTLKLKTSYIIVWGHYKDGLLCSSTVIWTLAGTTPHQDWLGNPVNTLADGKQPFLILYSIWHVRTALLC